MKGWLPLIVAFVLGVALANRVGFLKPLAGG